MINNKNTLFILIALIVLITTTGCITFKTDKAPVNDAGIFKTETRGDNWAQRTLMKITSGQPRSFGGLSVNILKMDPSDNQAIYLGGANEGLLYSYDGAKSWQVAKGLGARTISDVAIDPNSKCIIYATIGNELFKSTDCNRSWKSIYVDNRKISIKGLAVDHYDSTNIYIGTDKGEIIKSYNSGETWQTISRLKINIKRIIISPHDSRTIFIVASNGIHRSSDAGVSWSNLNKNLEEFGGAASYKDMIVSESVSGLIYLTVKYGILKSTDNGDNWENIELITPEKGATINAITVNPKNTDEIYYVTNTLFYRSFDGGENWTPKKLPTSGFGWKLLIDPKNPNIIYMGVKK